MNLHRSLSFVILIVTYSVTIAQNNPLYYDHELFIHTEGSNPYHNTVFFWMTAVDAVWDQDANIYELDTQKLIGSLNFARAYDINNRSNYNIPIPYLPNSGGCWGMENVLSFGYGSSYPQNIFGYGLYLAAFGYNYDEPTISFYLDYRDCDYTKNYAGADIWIKFNASNNTVKIDWNNSNFTDYVTTIENNNTYAIWNYMPKTLRQYIQNTNYLELYLRVSNSDWNPLLTWNPYYSMSANGFYRVERKIDNGNFIPIKETTSLSYIDRDITLAPGNSMIVIYRIKAINYGIESLPSNAIRLNLDGSAQKISIRYDKINIINSFCLDQNYPNPFNPSTEINFQIPEQSFVTLFIYDILGRELDVLLNKELPAGKHIVSWNGSKFGSGVFFYKITVRSNNAKLTTHTNKMVLLK